MRTIGLQELTQDRVVAAPGDGHPQAQRFRGVRLEPFDPRCQAIRVQQLLGLLGAAVERAMRITRIFAAEGGDGECQTALSVQHADRV